MKHILSLTINLNFVKFIRKSWIIVASIRNNLIFKVKLETISASIIGIISFLIVLRLF